MEWEALRMLWRRDNRVVVVVSRRGYTREKGTARSRFQNSMHIASETNPGFPEQFFKSSQRIKSCVSPRSTWSDMFPVLVIASPSLRRPEGEFEDCIFSSSIRVYSKPDARMEMVQRPVHYYYYYYVVGDTSSQHSLQGLPLVSQNPRY